MRRRTFVQKAVLGGLGFGVLRNLEACARSAIGTRRGAGAGNSFAALRDRYFLYQLDRNPVTSTYLGGDAYDPSLRNIDSRLRDYSPAALDAELRYYSDTRKALAAIDQSTLTAVEAVDRPLMDAQLGFLIHQLSGRYQEKSLDSYVAEPFRGVDWQIQAMSDAGSGLLGTEEEWQQVLNRTLATNAYLDVARANLLAGKRSGNMPDKRMVRIKVS